MTRRRLLLSIMGVVAIPFAVKPPKPVVRAWTRKIVWEPNRHWPEFQSLNPFNAFVDPACNQMFASNLPRPDQSVLVYGKS